MEPGNRSTAVNMLLRRISRWIIEGSNVHVDCGWARGRPKRDLCAAASTEFPRAAIRRGKPSRRTGNVVERIGGKKKKCQCMRPALWTSQTKQDGNTSQCDTDLV